MNITLNPRALVVCLLGALSLSIAGFAYANPSYFAAGVTTNSAASTTPAYMTPGAGTSTTPVYDAYAQTVSGGGTFKADQAGVLVQFCASSTATVLNIAPEYSADGIDYYRNFIVDPKTIGATTTPVTVITPFTTRWPFASSTLNGAAAGNQSCSYAALSIPTPFRFTRLVSSMTGGNGSVWIQLVPQKELK